MLPGGGARGAYEIGALSVLLPELEARGERVALWCGTSVGAINATALAARAHLPAAQQAAEVVDVWQAMRKRDVLASLTGRGGLRTAGRVLRHAVGVPGAGLASLLDPSPLTASLERWIDFAQLRRNVERGAVEAVSVVATSLAAGDPVAFTARRTAPLSRGDEAIRYVRTRLTGEHVRASAAIPVLFPSVTVSAPRVARGHYIDGGVRLNSPIKPALDLGADRVIVIGLEPFARAAGRPLSPREPSISDVAANVLDGLLVDPVAADLRRLAAINSFFVEDARNGTVAGARSYRLARGRAPYRPIAYALVAPRRRGEIGRLAEEVFTRRYGGLRGLRDLDMVLLSRALGAGSPARGELLSFLLFDPEFVAALIDLGRRDGCRWVARHPRIWCRDAAHDLDVGTLDRVRIRELETIAEFRAAYRR